MKFPLFLLLMQVTATLLFAQSSRRTAGGLQTDLSARGALRKSELPNSVDLRPQFERFGFPAPKQGNRDTCTTFADTALAEFESARHTDHPVSLSEEFLIWAGNEASGLTGDQAMFFKSVHGLQTFGICSAELMPYGNTANPDEKPSPEALIEGKQRKHWAVHWIKRWNNKTGLTQNQLLEIKHALVEGHPVATGMRWPNHLNLNTKNVVHIPAPTQVFDGHTVVQVGYRDDPREPGGGVFIFRNTNGPEWADNGYAYLPYAYLLRYVNDSLWLQPTKDLSDRTVVLEGENLQRVSTSHCHPTTQEMSTWGAKLWSHEKQLFCSCSRGGAITLAVPANSETRLEDAVEYQVSVLSTMAPDYGRIQAYWNGKPIGRPFDCFDWRVQPTGPIGLGVVRLRGPLNHFSVRVVGKNASSSNYNFGIDAIQFTRFDGDSNTQQLPGR